MGSGDVVIGSGAGGVGREVEAIAFGGEGGLNILSRGKAPKMSLDFA